MIERLRERMFRFAWRLNFAGRMIEKTRCTVREGFRRADDAIIMDEDWHTRHPSELADERLWIYWRQ